MAFAVIGVGLWLFAELNMKAREQTLNDTSLSVEERWRVEGSLQWWRDFSVTLYPLEAVLLIGGLLAIVLSTSFRGGTKEALVRWRIRYMSERLSDLEKNIDLRRQAAVQARVDAWRMRASCKLESK
jgi:hypothetical protein